MVLTDAALDKLSSPSKADKTMKKSFYSWTLGRYTYRDITLTPRERSGFTDAYAGAFFEDPDEDRTAADRKDVSELKGEEKADNLP